MDEYEDYGEEAPDSPEPKSSSSSSDEGSTTVNGHTVIYETKHMGHMSYALKWLHNHHSEAEEMFKMLKNGTEPEHKNYIKFKVDKYTYKLHKNRGNGYELEWKQA
jgi:hypothetical protein